MSEQRFAEQGAGETRPGGQRRDGRDGSDAAEAGEQERVPGDPAAAPAPRIAVTGATGQLGGRVARILADAGVPQRLLVRSPERAPRLPAAEIVRAGYDDSAEEALAGITTVLMVSAGEGPDRLAQHEAFLSAAERAGVRHIAYTSFFRAAPEATFLYARDHFHTEQRIRSGGMSWTFLRDNFYADILPGFAEELPDGTRVIRGPAGSGYLAPVTRDDVARAAAVILRDPASHAGRSYELTGPQELSMAEIAAEITRATGIQVRYQEETVEEARASRARYNAPEWELAGWISTYLAIARGELAPATADIEKITGRPATSFAAFLAAR